MVLTLNGIVIHQLKLYYPYLYYPYLYYPRLNLTNPLEKERVTRFDKGVES